MVLVKTINSQNARKLGSGTETSLDSLLRRSQFKTWTNQSIIVGHTNSIQNLRPKPWVKGQSGNPGGRPKSLMSLAREHTKDGKELIMFALKVLRAEITQTRYTLEGEPYEQPPTIKDRLLAMEWLADRGFGKAVETVDLKNSDGSLRSQVLMVMAKQLASGNELATLPTQSKSPISNPGAIVDVQETQLNDKPTHEAIEQA